MTKEDRKLDSSDNSRYNTPREKWVCVDCGNEYLEEREDCSCGSPVKKIFTPTGSNIL